MKFLKSNDVKCVFLSYTFLFLVLVLLDGETANATFRQLQERRLLWPRMKGTCVSGAIGS